MIVAIPKNKAEALVAIIRNSMDRDRELYRHAHVEQQSQQSLISIADEIMKLANLKEKGHNA